MNTTLLRLRYAQFLVVFLLGVLLYIISQSQPSNLAQFENNLWNRPFLITSFTKLRLTLGDRVFPQVLVGKDGWLEYTEAKNLDGYQNGIEILPGELKNTQQKLQKLYEKLHRRNITLLLVIAPNKATIYPDKLPDEIQKINQHAKLDQFAAYIKQHGPPVLLDLRSALQNARKKQDVYYKTNSHWNSYGAFVAYREIIKELSKNYDQLAPKNISDFRVTSSRAHPQDLAYTMGATNIFESDIKFTPKQNVDIHWSILNDDKNIPLQISTTPKTDSPTLLMYMDSFGDRLKDFISPHFKKAIYIFINSPHQDLITLNTIDIVAPNIVILEIVERHFNLNNGPNLNSFLNQIQSSK